MPLLTITKRIAKVPDHLDPGARISARYGLARELGQYLVDNYAKDGDDHVSVTILVGATADWQPIDTAPHEGDMLVRGGMFHHGGDAGPWPLEGAAHVRRLGRVFEVLNSRGAPTIVNPTEWKPV